MLLVIFNYKALKFWYHGRWFGAYNYCRYAWRL